jgi:hypothetical protein
MLALNDQRVGERQVSVKKDPLVWLEFENQIDKLHLPFPRPARSAGTQGAHVHTPRKCP